MEKVANSYCDDFYNGSIAEAIASFASVGGAIRHVRVAAHAAFTAVLLQVPT